MPLTSGLVHQSVGLYRFGQYFTFQLLFLSSSRDLRRHSHHLTSARVPLVLTSFVPQLSSDTFFLFQQVLCHVLLSLNVMGSFFPHHFQCLGQLPKEP